MVNVSSATVLKKEAVESKDEPKWIYIDDDRLAKVEAFLLKNSVLSQQLYRNQNQQPTVQLQPLPASGGSSALKANVPESGVSSQQQTQTSNVDADKNRDAKVPEFWQDSEVQEADFSNWEMPNTPKATSPDVLHSKTNNSGSTDSTAKPCKVKDIFSGLAWQVESEKEQGKLNEQLLEEYKQRQRMLESRNLWLSKETKKLPVASYR